MSLNAWKITRKGANRFVAKYANHPVAEVQITKGGKSWKFKNLDEMSSRVFGCDRYVILSFVLPMYGVKAPVKPDVDEGEEYVNTLLGIHMYIEEVDPAFVRWVETQNDGECRRFSTPMSMFLERQLSGVYKLVEA